MNGRHFAVAVIGFAVTPLWIAAYAGATTYWFDRDVTEWARHDAAVEMTRSLYGALDQFRRDNQRVPTRDEGLAVLVPRYVAAIPLDPWRREFVYMAHGGEWADILSLGADGAPGGHGLAADVSARYGSPGTTLPRSLQQVLFATLSAIPLVAFAAARRRPAAAACLAGITLFWACVVSITIAPGADLSLALAGASAAFTAALVGTVLALRGHPAGPAGALAGTFACQVATAAMMT